MVNKCVAPNCDYNYESEKKKRALNRNNETIGIFEFPKHVVDPEKRSRWIGHVPRVNWYLSKTQKLHLCENHFRPEDVITKSTDSNNRHKRKKGSDSLKRLKADALPCIWPGAPHLSKLTFPRPTSLSSSGSWLENQIQYQNEMENARIEKDTFNTLDELQEKGQLEKTFGILTSVTRDFILFFKLCYENIPKIQYSIKVLSDLTITVYFQGMQVKRSLVLEIASTTLNTCTAQNKVFSRGSTRPEYHTR